MSDDISISERDDLLGRQRRGEFGPSMIGRTGTTRHGERVRAVGPAMDPMRVTVLPLDADPSEVETFTPMTRHVEWDDADTPERVESTPARVFDVGEDASSEDGSMNATGIALLLGAMAWAIVLYVLWHGAGAEVLSCAPLIVGGTRYRPLPMVKIGDHPLSDYWTEDEISARIMSECTTESASHGRHTIDQSASAGVVRGPFEYYGTYWLAVRKDGSHVMNAHGRPHHPTRAAAERALQDDGAPEEEHLFSTPLPALEELEHGLDREFLMRTYAIEHAPTWGEGCDRDETYGILSDMGL